MAWKNYKQNIKVEKLKYLQGKELTANYYYYNIIGFGDPLLFRSYLTDRSQWVKANDHTSVATTIPYYISQGRNLSLLLFALFLNSFNECYPNAIALFSQTTINRFRK